MLPCPPGSNLEKKAGGDARRPGFFSILVRSAGTVWEPAVEERAAAGPLLVEGQPGAEQPLAGVQSLAAPSVAAALAARPGTGAEGPLAGPSAADAAELSEVAAPCAVAERPDGAAVTSGAGGSADGPAAPAARGQQAAGPAAQAALRRAASTAGPMVVVSWHPVHDGRDAVPCDPARPHPGHPHSERPDHPDAPVAIPRSAAAPVRLARSVQCRGPAPATRSDSASWPASWCAHPAQPVVWSHRGQTCADPAAAHCGQPFRHSHAG